jgi:S1-C subfamily serine protease
LVRLRTWIADHPERANALFAGGLDRAPGAPPTYLYTLFKTADGQMRAYVRPGGPAYAAGLRTNDVVEKIDGRYWWEYGTYTTERIPYDGKAHAFELTRGARTLDVRLGEPLRQE